jgi:hypothetical protein
MTHCKPRMTFTASFLVVVLLKYRCVSPKYCFARVEDLEDLAVIRLIRPFLRFSFEISTTQKSRRTGSYSTSTMSVATTVGHRLPCLLWLLLHFPINGFVVPSPQWNVGQLREGTQQSFKKHASATCCLAMSSGSDNSLPLAELLRQLDIRGIRYPPSASRADLLNLLSLTQEEEEGSAKDLQGSSSDRTHVLASTNDVRKSVEQADSSGTNQRPLTLLLAQLDIHNIRYEPSASRAELEALLKEHEQDEAQPANNEKKKSQQQQSHDISLKDLLSQLDERQIRYPPSASRKELKELLLEAGSDEGTKRQIRMPRESSTSKSQVAMSLRQLLAKLDEKQVRYQPSATRQQLEQLLLKSTNAVGSKRRTTSKLDAKAQAEAALGRDPVPSGATKKVPIRKILDVLDRRRIRYAPSASRAELEALLMESNVRNRKRRERKEQSSLKDLPLPARQTFDALRPGLSDLARKAAREAKYLSRNVRDYLAEDEDGVREPQWTKEKVTRESERSKSEPIDVEVVPVRPRRPPPSPPRPRSRASGGPTPQQRRRPVPTQKSTPLRRKRETSMTRTPYQLPSLDTESPPNSAENKEKASENLPEEEPPSARRRKVYNPYGAEVIDTRDAFDRFGDAFADAAESVLWGPVEEDDDEESSSTKRRSKKRKASQARYWKDRMEEQVDFFMGIHDDDSTYTNWENEVGDSRQRSVRGKSNNSTSQKRRNSKRVPIWEEEGSLVSLLFGRRASGGQLKLERFFENNEVGTNVLTKLIGSLFKGGLLVASYLCRWASVRGAVPQPVVVMAVASTAVSARAGKRFNMVLVTLLVLRTLGELIHGYVRGDQDWDDANEFKFAREGPSGDHFDDDIDVDEDDL